jgi:hypothetical protein
MIGKSLNKYFRLLMAAKRLLSCLHSEEAEAILTAFIKHLHLSNEKK